jgi:hypothetical protein
MTTRKFRVARSYYVSVQDDGRTAFLLGPFKSHEAALAQVDRGRGLTDGADPYAAFYAFGTSSLPADVPVKTVFGE